MRRAPYLFLVHLLAACAACSAQAPTNGGLIKRTPESVEQMRRSDRRLTLDVQVTDASGKPVIGLGQPDITVFDDGHAQEITSFREVNGSGGTPPAEVVLLLDTMNASFQDVVIARQGIERYLRQNGGHLALPVSIVFLADTGVKLGKPSQDGNALAEDLKKLPTPIRVIGAAQGGEGAQDRSQRSLRAVQMLSTYEATKPGRKLLIWVGPGWPLLSRSTADLSQQDHKRYFDSIVDVTTALRRSHVTVYSVAPLNLAQAGGQNPFLYKEYLKGVEYPTHADSTNLSLQVLAVHSGGLVSDQSGDLAGQIASCAADGQDYYEITFDAAEDDASIRYHALQIKVDRKDVTTRSSTAYYAGVPQATSAPPPGANAAVTTPPAKTAPPTLRAETRLIVVDVTALDKKGQPIKGLSLADFNLREDNTPLKIYSVEQHSQPIEPVDAAAANLATMDGTIVASNKPPTTGTWNVVLVDLYNTEKEDRGRLQSQLEQFLKQLPKNEPVSLVTMLSQIKIETYFQDGAGAAYRYLHKNGLGPLDGSTPANILGRPGQDVLMSSADLTGSTINNQANIDVDRQANRAQITLDCFSALAQWLAPYPGRKNVYWLSGGFPLEGKQFGVVGYGIGLGAETKGGHPLPMQQKTDKELETARVAIYPVDVHGVAATSADGVTNAGSTYEPVGTASALDNDLSAARRQEMLEIAKATGGTAHFNNDIIKVLSDDFSRANTYYTVTYTPPDKEWKGAYHRIELLVDKPETKLVYREGYYAQSAEVSSKLTPEQFKEALRLGAPSELAIQFTSKITKSGDSATVEYTVQPKAVAVQEDASGQSLTDIDFAIVEYDSKGKVLETSVIRLNGKMTQEQRADPSSRTISATQKIALKTEATALVLGVRDRISGRFGKLDVSLGGP